MERAGFAPPLGDVRRRPAAARWRRSPGNIGRGLATALIDRSTPARLRVRPLKCGRCTAWRFSEWRQIRGWRDVPARALAAAQDGGARPRAERLRRAIGLVTLQVRLRRAGTSSRLAV